MERIDLKALLFGIVADVGVTFVASVLLFALFAHGLVYPDMPPEEADAAMQALLSRGDFLLTSLVIGLACSALGGYVAARTAGRDLYLHAGLVGLASLLLGLLAGTRGPIWFNVAGFLLVLPAALYGGYLADRRING
ncbi:MAG TPA: hypothetical protein VF203_05085 [Burkholderiales bacterium]